MTVRVVLGDDHTLVRKGIKALLDSSIAEVVGEAEDGRALLRVVRALAPDVALVDVSMPLLNGIEATHRIGRLSPKTRVIVLSMYADKGYMRQAWQAGAWGYVLKDEAPDQLLAAITSVAAGKRYFPHGVPQKALEDTPILTEREREVLQLIAEGKKNAEIAQIMSRSLHTVRNHRARLMRKLGVHSATELVEAAERLGLVRFSPER